MRCEGLLAPFYHTSKTNCWVELVDALPPEPWEPEKEINTKLDGLSNYYKTRKIELAATTCDYFS